MEPWLAVLLTAVALTGGCQTRSFDDTERRSHRVRAQYTVMRLWKTGKSLGLGVFYAAWAIMTVCRLWRLKWMAYCVGGVGLCSERHEQRIFLDWRTERVQMVHPQNVRFQNVRFQNVWFQNVWNVRFTKRNVYKMSGLQNVRFTKRQVFKTSGCKRTSIYFLYLWLEEIRRFCCSHVSRQSDGSVLLSFFEVFCHISP